MLHAYKKIAIAGGDTSQPLAIQKRLNFIAPHINKNKRFIDCGCGRGDYVFRLIEDFDLDAFGIEYDQDKVQEGLRHPRYGEQISQGDLQSLKLPSNQWDYAMLNEVLEHVPNENKALREIHRILNPDGVLFVFSPNRLFPFETHGVKLRKNGKMVPHWIPFIPYIPLALGTIYFDYWARNYWPSQLVSLLQSNGFIIIQSGYIWQTFENISGRRPKGFDVLLKPLREISSTLEKAPFIKKFGVSQALVCKKI